MSSSNKLMENTAQTNNMSKSMNITKEIATTDGPIFYASRFLGLAPCSIQKKDRKIICTLSLFLCVYSYTIATIGVVWGTSGILNDIWAGNNTIRMDAYFGPNVMCGDLSTIYFLTSFGILSAPFRIKNIRKFYNSLLQIDSILPSIKVKEFRNLSYYFLGIILILITIVLVLDIYSWIRYAEIRSVNSEVVLQRYLPYYLSYYVVMVLELQYAQCAKHIEFRFKQLNENLAISELEKFKTFFYKNHKQPWTLSVKSPSSIKESKHLGSVLDYVKRNNKINDELFKFKGKIFITNATEYVFELGRVHSTLCEAVLQLNETFGFVVLLILVSGLLQSIETAYFLLVELYTIKKKTYDQDNTFDIILLFVWIGVHILRILIIIQPANSAMIQSKKTKVQVCNLLCYAKSDPELRKELEIFSLQLIHRKVEFTACGVCKLDRRLIPVITGAVITYLMILLQFI